MRNEENDCIRYLMKEMDPSEELLMERAMMEDEDLLIEVESMRQTLQKLDHLPEVEPPSHVKQSVLDTAAKHAQKRKNDTFRPAYKYAVAATLALTITAGGAWFFMGTEGGNKQRQQSTAENVTPESSSPAAQVSDQVQAFQFSERNIRNVSASQSSTIDPWIDRNDILRFEDQFSNEQFQAILKRSTKKLQLIENPAVYGGRVNSIQLTGSSGN